MPLEKKKRAALENEPAVEPATGTDSTQLWRSRQTEVDFFVEWLAEWRELMCSRTFMLELQRRRKRGQFRVRDRHVGCWPGAKFQSRTDTTAADAEAVTPAQFTLTQTTEYEDLQ
jgi:hypothetical protein